MTETVHGHEVMHMMLEYSSPFTRESLRQAIVDRFGVETRFYTCSESNMDADEIITFLEARGKFVSAGAGFQTEAERICNH